MSDNLERISLLSWGEHCTECAAPACYETCDLYQARPDTRCRRFLFGIHKNRHFASFRGYGAEVAFKKWGVLAAIGSTTMAPKSAILWGERLMAGLTPILNVFGRLLGRFMGDTRWRYPSFGLSRRFCRWLHSRNTGRIRPDAFLLEVFNPSEPVRMQLLMDYAPDVKSKGMIQIRQQFRATMEFPKGYSCHDFERPLFQNFTDSGEPFMVSLTPEADTSPNLVFLSADFVTYKRKQASVAGSPQPPIKCVVWDLDHTLWKGVLIEDRNVTLRDDIRSLLQILDQRGILSSIASKNDHDTAWKQLQALGLSEYFLFPQINWNPKSQNVRTIASKLNIGLDSIAFVDDNPFELDEVKAALPSVTCINANDIGELKDDQRFRGVPRPTPRTDAVTIRRR